MGTVKKAMPKMYAGKSTKLGHGGRAAKLMSTLTGKGYSPNYAGAIVGKIARAKQAAPGQKNYHGTRSGKSISGRSGKGK